MGCLQGKAIVITGAGRGIGAATARLAAQSGAKVVVNDCDLEAAQGIVDAVIAAGGEAIAHGADISDWDQAADLINTCKSRFGSVDGLVNNAGHFSMALLTELVKGDFETILAANVIGTANCAAHAAREMVRQGSGSIINVISGAHMGLPAMGVYGASKGAAASLTYTWALELAGTGVRVNAVSPMAETRMADIAEAYYKQRGITPPRLSIKGEANAPVYVWLLSDEASDVHGQIVRIEGDQCPSSGHLAQIAA